MATNAAGQLSLTLSNQSQYLLEFVEVRTSCGCAAVQIPQQFLQPDESVKAEILLDAVDQPGRRQIAGRIIYTLTSGEDTQLRSLNIQCDVLIVDKNQ